MLIFLLLIMDIQNLRYLFIKKVSKDDTSQSFFCGLFNLKISVRLVCLINILIISILLALYVLNSDIETEEKIKNYVLGSTQLIVFILLLISTVVYNSTLAYLGLFLFQIIFWTHVVLFLVCAIYAVNGEIDFIFPGIANTINWFSAKLLISFTVFIIIESFFIWICFCYTYHLCLGNDAYINGEYFDKYVENLASSRNSSVRGTPVRNSFSRFSDEF